MLFQRLGLAGYHSVSALKTKTEHKIKSQGIAQANIPTATARPLRPQVPAGSAPPLPAPPLPAPRPSGLRSPASGRPAVTRRASSRPDTARPSVLPAGGGTRQLLPGRGRRERSAQAPELRRGEARRGERSGARWRSTSRGGSTSPRQPPPGAMQVLRALLTFAVVAAGRSEASRGEQPPAGNGTGGWDGTGGRADGRAGLRGGGGPGTVGGSWSRS